MYDARSTGKDFQLALNNMFVEFLFVEVMVLNRNVAAAAYSINMLVADRFTIVTQTRLRKILRDRPDFLGLMSIERLL